MSLMRRGIQIFLATLREIFDEAAYARFLERHHICSSVHAYADFCRERDSGRGPRPKCC